MKKQKSRISKNKWKKQEDKKEPLVEANGNNACDIHI
jgi:hypothetical protein